MGLEGHSQSRTHGEGKEWGKVRAGPAKGRPVGLQPLGSLGRCSGSHREAADPVEGTGDR